MDKESKSKLRKSSSSFSFKKRSSLKNIRSDSSSNYGAASRVLKSVNSLSFSAQLERNLRNISLRKAPNIKIESRSASFKYVSTDDEPTMYLKLEEDGKTVSSVLFKKHKLDLMLLRAIQATCTNFQSITELNLQFCKLTNKHMRMLQTILKENEFITHVNLDGNPMATANYYLLLQNTKIQFLSLRLCQLNCEDAKMLANELRKPYIQTLLYLNLASNFIGNDGIKNLADALKANRCLLGLNLSDNRMDGQALVYLFEVFKIFPLNHKEIVFARHKNMEYWRKRQSMITDYKARGSSFGSNDSGHETGIVDIMKHKSCDFSLKKSKASGLNVGSKKQQTEENKKIEAAVDLLISPDSHPFVKESYPENKNIFCRGNKILTYLNLGFNSIIDETLLTAIEVLKYQRENEDANEVSAGLQKLIFEGQNVWQYANLLEEIFLLLNPATHSKTSTKYSEESSKTSIKSGKKRMSYY